VQDAEPEASAQREEIPDDVFCMSQIGYFIKDTSPMWGSDPADVYGAIARACEAAQPLLANAAREAQHQSDPQRALTLLRAARKHPAFPSWCDVPDAQATQPSEKILKNKWCGETGAPPCAFDVGTHLYLATLLRVAVRPEGEPLEQQHTSYSKYFLMQLGRHYYVAYGRCNDRRF
jgi:hypothetical protein